MSPSNLAFATIEELGALLRKREISPVEIVEQSLSQIARWEPELCAHITVLGEEALAAARKAESDIAKGKYRGPLHGVPYSAKDVLDTKGIRTTGGTKLFDDYRPTTTATVIRKLDAAGAILVGKNNLSEMAMGGTRVHSYGAPVNPWNRELGAGGSSSGSAVAVATGMCAFSIGTDTGGSIRSPSRLAALYGLKPTFGRVSRNGVWPVAWAIDTVGPIARSPKDCGLVLTAIAGPDPKDFTTRNALRIDSDSFERDSELRGLRIGIIEELIDTDSDSPSAKASLNFISFLEESGAEVERVQLPVARQATIAYMAIRDVDNTLIQTDLAKTAALLDRNTRLNIVTAALLPASSVSKARRIIAYLTKDLRSTIDKFDALVWSSRPVVGPRTGAAGRPEPATPDDVINNYFASRTATMFANISGIPAMAVPTGFDHDGSPLGVQIGGRINGDEGIINIARAWQTKAGRFQRPPLVAEAKGSAS